MELLRKITWQEAGDKEGPCTRRRETVRAVLLDSEGKIALLHIRKYGYYTICGGGIEPGESREEALAREAAEETGCRCKVLGELGTIEEWRAYSGVFQTSYCYLAAVVGEKGIPAMTEEEAEEETCLEWQPLEKAMELIAHSSERRVKERYIKLREQAALQRAEEQLRTQA